MAGIYISYPFCAQKCTFCNFASGVHGPEIEERYLQALLREIAQTPIPFTPDTLYLGGGTPSSMAPDALTRIFDALPYSFREATIEAAPGTVTLERVRQWRTLGINRVSLGVQSFITPELRRTGRRHTAKLVAQEISLMRSEGMPNFSIDLIAGLPGQTSASWSESLQWIDELQPPHVSVYMFEIDEDSSLGSEVLLNGRRYGAPDLPSEDLTAEFYETAVSSLATQGLSRYEISNFARPGSESVHNLKYWQLAPYLGFGADAHSFTGTHRSQNPDSVAGYLANDAVPIAEPADATERFWVGLRLMNGIVPSPEELRTHRRAVDHLISQGLLEKSGPALRLTARGVMVSNEVFEEFLPA